MSTSVAASNGAPPMDSLERPLVRIRLAIEQVERELRSLRAAYLEAAQAAIPVSVAEYGRGALSRQERRVARLLAEGRTNREIAATLHVSVHTVKSQVQSILRKRGLHSRWQVDRTG
jgi:DNA-binding NarL/FixJ family response regulator